jgi:hypothetical protein
MHCSLRSPVRLAQSAALVVVDFVGDDWDLLVELWANAVPLKASAIAAAMRYARDVMYESPLL